MASKGLAPGSNGELHIILEAPVKAAEGSRYLLESNGKIIAAGLLSVSAANKRMLSDWFSAALQTSRKCGR